MRFAKTIASASVAAVIGLAGVSVAGAVSGGGSPAAGAHTVAQTQTQTPDAGPAAAAEPGAKARARALRRRFLRRAGALAAETIGIAPKALAREVAGGKTVAQVATEHGVQPQAVVDALEQAARARIEQAKSAGRITADRATKLEQRVDTIVPKFVNDWHPRRAAAGGAGA